VPARVLTRRQRAAARLVTGPLAHLVCGVADWVELVAKLAWARLRRRRAS
jgi:hypothetical protein